MKKLLEFKDVTIKIKDEILFPVINFSIFEGDSFVFQGENGTGKSLILELIALGNTNDLNDRYDGLVIDGQILDSNGNDLLDPYNERKFSYVSQTEDFYKGSTVLSEAMVSSAGIGLKLDVKELDELLVRFNLLHKKKKKIKNNLSDGEAKIVHIVTRLLKLKESNLLILDEPLNHLSFKNIGILNDVINEIKNKNPKLTIIVVSHNKEISFVDRIIKYNYHSNEFDVMKYNHLDN